MVFQALQQEEPQNNKQTIYQLFVRHFGNTKSKGVRYGSRSENGCGTFMAITDHALFELSKLGISHIWLTGVLDHATCTDYSALGLPADDPFTVKGRAGSPYAIRDYYNVAPDLAETPHHRMAEFEDLVSRIHQAGMKVLLDFVPNHVARSYYGLSTPAEHTRLGAKDDTNQAFSPDHNFYYLPEEKLHPPEDYLPLDGKLSQINYIPLVENPAKVTGNGARTAYPSKDDWFETIKLNYGWNVFKNNEEHFSPMPDTWLRMLNIVHFWAKKGVDGFRCDMVELVPLPFWEWMIPTIKEDFPDLLFIGETYQTNLQEAFYNQGRFDYLYDKSGLYDCSVELDKGEVTADALPQVWKAFEGQNNQLLRFMENHDEQRVASQKFMRSPQRAMPHMTLAASWTAGPVMIYNGQELGETGDGATGFSEDDGKTSIFDYIHLPRLQKWYLSLEDGSFALDKESKQVREFYRRLLNVCRAHPAINSGKLYDLHYFNNNFQSHNYNGEQHYSYLRLHEAEMLLCVLNFTDQEWQEVYLKIPQEAWELSGYPREGRYLYKDLLHTGFVFEFTFEELMREGSKGGLRLHLPAHAAYLGKIFRIA